MKWPHSLPFAAPRGLRRQDAAAYIGLSASKFDELVNDGRMPKPKRIDGAVVWDRLKIDIAFDALPGDEEEPGADIWSELR